MDRVEVAHRIARQLGLDFGEPMPWAYKVAALVEGDEIVYLDALKDGNQRGDPWTGEILVLTKRRVVTARIDGPAAPSGSRVTCWRRRSLAHLLISEGADQDWDERTTGLPYGARLRLEYRGDRVLPIPLDPTSRQSSTALGEVLPSLLDDLDG
jgi:hypothetical protein